MPDDSAPAIAQDVEAPAERPEASAEQPAVDSVLADAVLADAVDLAREAIEQITPASTIGEHVGVVVEGERVLSHRFACTLAGYPGWRWTVTLARVDGAAEPGVLEVELLPGEDALLAPDWVPWSERLAEYRASLEAAKSAEGDEKADDDTDDDDLDDADDDDLDAADDDIDGVDIDGVDIDALHDEATELDDATEDADADYESDDITGVELAALDLQGDEPDDAERDADSGAPQPPQVVGGETAGDEQQDDEGDHPQR